jgi:uncharacterized protein YukE
MNFLGNRDAVARVASALLAANEVLVTAQSNLTTGVTQLVPGQWHGTAASRFQDHWTAESASIDSLAAVMVQIATALDEFATEIQRAERIAMDGESIAHSAGLEVGPDGQVFDHEGASRFTLALSDHQQTVRAEAQDRLDTARAVADAARAHAFESLSTISVPTMGDQLTMHDVDAWAQGSSLDQPSIDDWSRQNGGRLASDVVQIGIGGTGVETGLGMVGAGIGSEAGGVALDGTGVGAVVGVSLNVAGVPLVVAGAAVAMGGGVVAGAGLIDGLGRIADGIGVLLARKQQPPELSAAEREAVEDKAHGNPYDQKAYKDAMRKIRRAEKFQGQRNKQKRAGG